MRGAYCIVCDLAEDSCIKVGSLGQQRFPKGVYVYIGSAQQGIEQRVGRHKSNRKKMRWHIDYFLKEAEVVAVVAVPSEDKTIECKLAREMRLIAGATIPIAGFGSSDCECGSHLVYLGDEGIESMTEAVVYRMSVLGCMYPKKMAPNRTKGRRRQ